MSKKLTKKTLIKNGWARTENYEWYKIGTHLPFIQEYEDGSFDCDINGYKYTIATVEDLCDLLKLVGRMDLAFKIKNT